MAIALVSHIARTLAGTTSAIDTSAANFLVAVVFGATTTNAPTDSESNTWSPLTQRSCGFGGRAQLFYVENATVDASQTFTTDATVGGLCVASFSGVKTSAAAFDTQSGADSQSSPTTTTLTPSEDNELVITCHVKTFQGTTTVGNGFTMSDLVNGVNGVNFGGGLAYLIQTSAASADPAWTFTEGDLGIALASFKADGGGATGQPTMRRWGGVQAMGGAGILGKSRGRAWGRTRTGIMVPRRFAA